MIMNGESKTRDDLIEQADIFGKTILESSEYRNLIRCNERLEEDSEAKELLRKFRLKQLELQMNGFDRKVLGELNDLETQMQNNETLSNLESSQMALASLFKSSNNLISEKISLSFAQKRGGCY